MLTASITRTHSIQPQLTLCCFFWPDNRSFLPCTRQQPPEAPPTALVFCLRFLCRVSHMLRRQSWKTSKKSSHLSQKSAHLVGSWAAQERLSGMSTGKPYSHSGSWLNFWYSSLKDQVSLCCTLFFVLFVGVYCKDYFISPNYTINSKSLWHIKSTHWRYDCTWCHVNNNVKLGLSLLCRPSDKTQ